MSFEQEWSNLVTNLVWAASLLLLGLYARSVSNHLRGGSSTSDKLRPSRLVLRLLVWVAGSGALYAYFSDKLILCAAAAVLSATALALDIFLALEIHVWLERRKASKHAAAELLEKLQQNSRGRN